MVDPLFVQPVFVQPVFVLLFSSNPNLIGLDEHRRTKTGWTKTRCTVPEYYKNSHVCPIYNKGDRAIPGNYRLVSLISHIVKICEHILRKVIIEFVETNRILSSNQHGFRSGRSCLTQMLAHFDIYQGFCNNKDTDSNYLDYAKAFDKVDHKLLIMKLKNTDSIRR